MSSQKRQTQSNLSIWFVNQFLVSVNIFTYPSASLREALPTSNFQLPT